MTDEADAPAHDDTPPPWSGAWSPPSEPVWATTPPPAGPRGTGVPWVAILAVVVVGVLLVGVVLAATGSISGSSHHIAVAPATTLPPITLPGNGSGTLSPDQTVLRQLGARQSDMAAGETLRLIQAGDQVVNTTTLDLCNGTFASETHRAARRQVVVLGSDGSVDFSTESVFYDDAGGTAQAFTELRATAAKCPRGPVSGPDGPAEVTHFNPAPDAAWPATPTVERLAYDFTTTDESGTSRAVAVYLRRGRVLMGIYFDNPGQAVTVAGQSDMAGIVNVLAGRLAKLPDSIITGHEAPAAVPGAV